jgi:hypothetical protein
MKTKSGKTGVTQYSEYHKAIEEQLLRKKDFSGVMQAWKPYIVPQQYHDQLKRCEEFRKVPSLPAQIQGCGNGK